ncbi:MAG: DMT family transporter [Methanobacteriota archaeon]
MRGRFGLATGTAVVMASFAANSAITRLLVAGDFASPYALTAIRFGSGFVMVAIVTALFPDVSRPAMRRPDVVGSILLGAYALSISYGYRFISAAAGTLVFYAFVVTTMATASRVLDRERLTSRALVGQAFAFAGVAAITFGGIREVTLLGVALMGATGTSWGLYSVQGRRTHDPRGFTYGTFLLVGVVLGLSAALVDVSSLEDLRIDASLEGLGLALFMGMVTTALSYVLWQRVLGRIRASQGGVAQLTVPVIASAMGIVLLGESLTPALVVGGAAVLVGIHLNRVRGGQPRTSGSPSSGR